MTLALSFIVGSLLIVAVWNWSVRGADDTIRVAVIASLATVATIINVITPVPGVEVTSLVVVCCALQLDSRVAMATGIVCTIAVGATAGLGPWTVWQVLGIGSIVVLARLARSTGCANSMRRWPLVLLVVVCALVYDVITTVGGVFSVTGTTSIAGALLLGLPFMLVHLVAVGGIAALGGSALLAALDRVAAQRDAISHRSARVIER